MRGRDWGNVGRGLWGKGCGEGTGEMQGWDCGERDAGRGLGGKAAETGQWGKGCRDGTVGKGMLGGDCGERDAGRGLWEKGCREETVGKEMLGGDCGERDEAGDCGERCWEGTVWEVMPRQDWGERRWYL